VGRLSNGGNPLAIPVPGRSLAPKANSRVPMDLRRTLSLPNPAFTIPMKAGLSAAGFFGFGDRCSMLKAHCAHNGLS
jgi:hypothetical protein